MALAYYGSYIIYKIVDKYNKWPLPMRLCICILGLITSLILLPHWYLYNLRSLKITWSSMCNIELFSFEFKLSWELKESALINETQQALLTRLLWMHMFQMYRKPLRSIELLSTITKYIIRNISTNEFVLSSKYRNYFLDETLLMIEKSYLEILKVCQFSFDEENILLLLWPWK